MDNYSIAPILILLASILIDIAIIGNRLKKSNCELKQIKEELIEIKKALSK